MGGEVDNITSNKCILHLPQLQVLTCYLPLSSLQVRKRSKACRAGLKEHDELVTIGDQMCAELSHAQAMNLIDTQSATLNLRVKRSEHGLTHTQYITHSLSLLHEAISNKLMHFHNLSSVCFPGPRLDSTPHLTLVTLHHPAPP